MKTNTENATNSKHKLIKVFLIIFFVSFAITAAFMVLTKKGIIPNFFDAEFLCPKSEWEKHLPDGFQIPKQDIYDDDDPIRIRNYKPVIYLYPTSTEKINVSLDFNGELTATYPDYGTNGWQVVSNPDGSLINLDGKEYSYLFWEGDLNPDVKFDMSKGFVVKGSEMREFLQEKLSEIGLTPKEYNEFIVYWYPQMKDNAYNLISFIGKEYTDNAKLEILPKPDSILRVFMAYKPLDYKISVTPQTFEKFNRNGFTVVEWGGTRVN